ncbi:MAG TPA: ribose-phosphate diphosphokinase [Spirochaetota bacterium]|nr:ribose-phosphate diphosphokinase [Spirochaetota bacterium]HOL57450.1 ribose-phosphate diphosphokinase [Spirochaetota bacterium]
MNYTKFFKGPIKLFPLPGTEEYVGKIAKWLAKSYFNEIKSKNLDIVEFFLMDEEEEKLLNNYNGDIEEFIAKFIVGGFDYFAHKNGAIEVSIKNSARRKDAYVFHTFSEVDIVDYNGVNRHLSLSDQELLLYNTLDAFLEAKVERVTIFEMNLGQARSDRPKGRGSCNLRTFFRNITANGANHLILYQIHSNRSLIGIDNTRTTYDNLSGENLLKKYILRNHVKTVDYFKNVVQKEWIISSVDAGGKQFAAKFAKAFNVPLLVVDKRRNSLTNLIEEITVLKPDSLSIEGKTVFIVDDMIDSGGSIMDVCKKYKELGAKEIIVAVVYGLFSPPAEERLTELYKSGALNKVIVTDLALLDKDFYKRNSYIEIADTSYTTARIIQKTNQGRSLEKYFLPLNAEEYLRTKVENTPN